MFQKLISGEKVIVKIKTKSDIAFWQYQLLGVLSLFTERRNNFFIITDKRIIITQKDSIKHNIEYNDFYKISFNSKSDVLTFFTLNNEEKKVSLTDLKLEYDDYQYIKHQLHAE
ncbi:hypothetical protein [Bizionia myxarmorum]|uniref:YokE-like PH domain-containing protein n=1 Tax=Bizionia myxarmorum TaxID=291186 RepID=A0A5D0RF15_9FLAO|nr:hypothetical protein [Bizionia myxarmorum]TYB79288.1 hypothetical protein ES674_05810 [Bizionia myxarmorum]